MSVTTRIEDNVGYVEINNPPVNAIGLAVRQGLLDAVSWAEKERLERVIVTGAGKIFAAGADTKEFDHAPVEPHLPDVLNAIEKSFVPWIAAINGVALGGGAEIAMACRMRIMDVKAKIGLPEVTLGVIPGAGGTQRLPKLVGLETSLSMISQGKPVDAKTALTKGLVHAIEADVLDAAFMVNSEELLCRVPTWELPSPEPDANVIENARQLIANKARGQNAPSMAIDVIESGLTTTFDEGLALERRTFIALRSAEQAKALRHIFFSERGAKAPKWLSAQPQALEHIAVAGGGTMGAGIAYALLNAGKKVTVLEIDQNAVERAAVNINRIIDASQARGLLTPEKVTDIQNRLHITTDYSSISDATLAIEAAFESMDVKRAVFEKFHEVLPAHATIATNTSYLDVNEIAAFIPNPGRVLGLHFFAPAYIMKLLEIVRADQTHDVHLAQGFELGKILRKIPVIAGVCDGFIGNRILSRYREAADTVLMDGSTPWEVDEAMVDFGYAMGPYEAQDLSGLDIAHANRRRQDATRDPNRRYIPIADRMVELGKLGKKTGAGWYRYPGGGGKVDDPIVADLALEEARLAGLERKDYSTTEIKERLLAAMINEASDILFEGIAQSASDIDLVTVFGYGFPRWRGGLMHYADTLGAQAIVDTITALAEEDPIAWKVSPLLLQCVNNGTTIADYKPAKH